MFDLKTINSVLDQLEEERGIPREKMFEAIESALATAYKREYGKKGQIIRSTFDINTGKTEFYQVKIVVDPNEVRIEDESDNDTAVTADKKALKRKEGKDSDKKNSASSVASDKEDEHIRFDPEKHIFIEDALKIKKGVKVEEEITFPLEQKGDFGRIAAQTAKQVIIQKIREAEKVSVLQEFGERQGDIVSGTVQRIERGNIFVDFGRATGILPYEEQIPGERYKQGERIRAYLYSVEESARGVFLRLSRSHPKFLAKLFEMETPELTSGVVEIKEIAREAGSRSKIAIVSNDEHIDPVGSLVGQRGVRVSTVMSELGGEKIDVIEWSEDPMQFIEDALSPASVMSVDIDEKEKKAIVEVSEDQQSLAIGKGGQNVRLAAKLTGWKIDIRSIKGENIAEVDAENVEIKEKKEEEPLDAARDDSAESQDDKSKDADVSSENKEKPTETKEEIEKGSETETQDTKETSTTAEETKEKNDKTEEKEISEKVDQEEQAKDSKKDVKEKKPVKKPKVKKKVPKNTE